MTPNLKDLYGSCRLETCQCLARQKWLGRDCEHWQPMGPETQEDLARYMREHREQARMLNRDRG